MKKFLLILPFLAVISCHHYDQQVILGFDAPNQSSTLGNNTGVDVTVYDVRAEKKLLGRKTFSNEEIEITSNVDLAAFVQFKITQNLMRRGFKPGHDKIINVYIETFDYKAKSGFGIGTSRIEAGLKIVVADSRTGLKFTKNYGTAWDNKHFIVPLEETDSRTINLLLKDILQEILLDDSFIESLVR